MKRNRLIALLLAVALIMTSAVTVSFADDGSQTTAETPAKTDAELGIDSAAAKRLDSAGVRNILVLGLDSVNDSDAMLILSYNEKTKKANLVSVNRITYMQLDDHKIHEISGKPREFCLAKLPTRNGIGDEYLLMRELNRHMDLNIREYVSMDWNCIAQMIDTFASKGVSFEGNITSKDMLEAINALIGSKTSPVKGAGDNVVLNGWQAVEYLRVRDYTGGSSLVREARCRSAFIQLFNKVKKMKVADAEEIYKELSGKVGTNMADETVLGLLARIGGITIKDTPSWPYKFYDAKDADKTYDYHLPNTLESNVNSLHIKYMEGKSYKASTTVKSLSNTIKKRALDKKKRYISLINTKIKIKSLKKGKKSFTVKWSKQDGNGYQIRYSLKKNMKKAKTVTIKKAKTTSKKITKLKKKKTYYVQVRYYRTIYGKKYYSAWSAKKKVKVK